jgi:Ca2+-binding EF-hand superfamily protein
MRFDQTDRDCFSPTRVCKATLSPVWFAPSRTFTLPTGNAVGVRVEVYDKDLIGSDEFMGQGVIKFADLKPSSSQVSSHITLNARPGKKDKVSGSVSINYTYVTDKYAAEQKELERMQQEKAQELAAGAGETKLPFDKVKKAAEYVSQVTKGGDKMTTVEQLEEVLTKLDVLLAFTNMNVLLFSSKETGAASQHALKRNNISSAAVDDMLHSQEMRQARGEFLMELFDVNKDGEVSFQELLLGLAMQSEGSPKERAAFYFDVFDEDKSGSLSRDEVNKLHSMMFRSLYGMVSTGIVTELKHKPEVTAVLSDSDIRTFANDIIKFLKSLGLEKQLTDHVFDAIDDDKNAQITKEEYTTFLADEDQQQALHNIVQSAFAEMQRKLAKFSVDRATELITKKYRF